MGGHMKERLKERLLDVSETAQLLGNVHVNTVYRMKKERVLPFIKIGRLLRFRESDIFAWIEQQQAQKG